MDRMGVHVVYRDSKGKALNSSVCPLNTYTELLRQNMIRTIGDVEDMIYETTGTQNRDEWSDSLNRAYGNVRHRLLDCAGNIERLADDLCEMEEEVREENSRPPILFGEGK